MKVSEFLKKIGTITQAEIWIEFKANKKDTDPDLERLTENTPEEKADQVIERASGYTLQEVNLNENAVTISAVKIEKRTPKPKPEKKQDERREEQKPVSSSRTENGKKARRDSGSIKERAGSSPPDPDTDIQERRGRTLKILDLYCKAGGASAGYARAGFEVVGVDIEDQPNYPYKFIKMDAIEFLKTQDISEYDAIHASPPCQAHTRAKHLSAARNGGKYRDHKDLIQATRELLQKSGKPYVIENVVGAPLIKPIALNGTQFKNIYTQRRRMFESNIELKEPDRPYIKKKTPTAGNGFGQDGFISICGSGGVRGMNAKQIILYWGFALGGIDWMTRAELAEAIPPVYTEFIGKQIIDYIKRGGGADV